MKSFCLIAPHWISGASESGIDVLSRVGSPNTRKRAVSRKNLPALIQCAGPKKLFILVFGLTVLCGCVKRLSLPTPPAILSTPLYTPANYASDVVRYNAALAATPGNLAAAKDIRNAIVYQVMTQVDYAYGSYAAELFVGKGTIGVVQDAANLGMVAASTLAGNPATKTILGILSGAVIGLNLSANNNFFAQQSFQTLAIAMQTRRDKARESIQKALASDVSTYPLQLGLRDLTSYYFAGTLAGGLQEMQEEASAAAQLHTANGLH